MMRYAKRYYKSSVSKRAAKPDVGERNITEDFPEKVTYNQEGRKTRWYGWTWVPLQKICAKLSTSERSLIWK